MSRKVKEDKKTPGLAELTLRIAQLEEMVLRNLKLATGLTDDNELNATVDMTPFMTLREKSPLLIALYPGKEDGSRIYAPLDSELGTTTSGMWPSGRQWLGLYLGGGDSSNTNRRVATIPLCLSNGLPFYSPLGLTSSASDTLLRLEAMNACSSAILDFSGEGRGGGGAGGGGAGGSWTHGFELIYFFSTGFMHVSTIAFPISTAAMCLKFEEGDRIMNVCGPHLALTERKRREDFYSLLRYLIDAMEGWTELASPKMLEQSVVNYRANFIKPHLEGVRLTVLDRYAIVKNIPSMESDIGSALKTIATMLVLSEMRTKEFMDANTGNEWAWTRSEYANLQLRAEKASQMLSELEGEAGPAISASGRIDERVNQLQAFVDLVSMTDAVLANVRHLM